MTLKDIKNFLIKLCYVGAGGYWIDPKGTIYDVKMKSHFEWLKKNVPEFKKASPEEEGKVVATLIQKGWIRARFLGEQLGFNVNALSRKNLSSIDDFIFKENKFEFRYIYIDVYGSEKDYTVDKEDWQEADMSVATAIQNKSRMQLV